MKIGRRPPNLGNVRLKPKDKIIILLILLSGVLLINYLAEAGFHQLRARLVIDPVSTPFSLDTSKVPDFWNTPEILNASLNDEIVNSTSSNDLNRTQFMIDVDFINSTIRIFVEARVPLNYTGPRPAIVFVHGFGGNSSQTFPYMEYFSARGYATFAMDLPGFPGNSTGYPSLSSTLLLESQTDPRTSTLFMWESTVLRTISLAIQH